MSEALKQAVGLSVEQKRALAARMLRDRKGAQAVIDESVQRLFERQAKRVPDSIAVSGDGRSWTYSDLNGRANRLARRLRGLGVGPESLVGLCVDRSPEMVAGLLGILKAGGAYVPIDPGYPDSRVAFMVEDAGAAVLVTNSDLRERLPDTSAQTICVDSDWDDPNGDELPVRVSPGNLAYVIYTSGSTGTPKGVQVTHGALTNFLKSMRQLLSLDERDALLAVTTLSFDIAALELYLPLAQGATIELASRDEAADAALLARRLADPAVTFMQATPATWRMLLESGWSGKPGLAMLCGGEALPRDLADRLLPLGAKLWNLYGPTETTIWSSAAAIEPGDVPVTIGRPIANTRMCVLDARLRPVPVGVTGELYIGGAGLARGYLRRPGLTAERFLPDPTGQPPGARIYRTGDLARWRPDGTLECLGRVDYQVKIRGFRVELGEVEAALARHPAVKQVVATAREDTPGDKRLVAYLVAEQAPTGAELRGWLEDKLPEPMIPTVFVVLDTLPLTPNGKVDRNALPAPEAAQAPAVVPYEAPRGPIDEALAATWAELLGKDRVGIRDNFFDLGGHSLLAAQVQARVRDLFGVELPLRDMFDVPTVAGLAGRIEAALRAGSELDSPPITPVAHDGLVPASFAQQRLWLLDQLDPQSAAYNIATAVRLVGELDPGALGQALNEVVRRHESLRTTFTARDGVPYQVIADGIEVALPIEDLTAVSDPEAEARRRTYEEAARPFNLAQGPLVRAGLLKLGPRDHVAHVTLHHIIADGWSLGVLVREVSVLYESFARGRPSPLPELTVQYTDYSAWQRSWLQGDVLARQIDYWTRELAGVPHLELPTDRPRGTRPGRTGGVRRRVLPRALADRVRVLGRRENATPFMVLIAALEALLYRYTGQEDFAIGTPIAGRSRSEIEGLIGFFVNTLVLRADLAGEPGMGELIRRVRRRALGAYAHQDLPFERLVAAVQAGGDAGHMPLFRVMLAIQNAPVPALESPGLAITPLDTEVAAAKFDLILFAADMADGLHLDMEYDADLFDAMTIDRLLEHLETLLEGAVADADQPVADLPMLSEAERQMMLNPAGEPDDETESLADLSEEEIDRLLLATSTDESDRT
jgi:amino acid adenylation domain-containing protein